MQYIKKLTLCLLLLITFTSNATLTNDEKIQLFAQSNLKTKYVMIGDSITAQGVWSELLSTPSVANRGISGETSNQILNRINGILKVKAQKAFILMGANDFSQRKTAEEVYENYIKLVDALKSNNTAAVIQTTTRCNIDKQPRWKTINEEIKKLNKMLQIYASDNGIEFIDLDSSLSDSKGLLDKYSPDGIHLNLAGFKKWSALIKEKM